MPTHLHFQLLRYLNFPARNLLSISGVIFLLFLFSCSSQPSLSGTCGSCHQVNLDPNHQIACTQCHGGDSAASKRETAHSGILAKPAHPDNLSQSCGTCHLPQAENLRFSLHYTLKNSVNQVREAFGAPDIIDSFKDIPVQESINGIDQLADDMLRRRCLRCHLYSNGDDYTATNHGTGCAACHMPNDETGKIQHTFLRTPPDTNCLSCHYGNRVGFDYYGRFEHDFNDEYRTPYTVNETTDRPYGVEYHQLVPDVHQQRGMICVDCHGGISLMQKASSKTQITCGKCHDEKELQKPPFITGIAVDQNGYTFTSRNDGKQHTLPIMQHPAHSSSGSVDCQVCHAQWSFNDVETHLLRSDLDEYEQWVHLTVQGSYELETLLKHNLNFDNEELPAETTDKITDDMRPGVWYKGYTMRRWESVLTGYDEKGNLRVMRPLLNMRLSWIDENENVLFDNYQSHSPRSGMRPYTPHTTGPAGLFYQQRIPDAPAATSDTIVPPAH